MDQLGKDFRGMDIESDDDERKFLERVMKIHFDALRRKDLDDQTLSKQGRASKTKSHGDCDISNKENNPRLAQALNHASQEQSADQWFSKAKSILGEAGTRDGSKKTMGHTFPQNRAVRPTGKKARQGPKDDNLGNQISMERFCLVMHTLVDLIDAFIVVCYFTQGIINGFQKFKSAIQAMRDAPENSQVIVKVPADFLVSLYRHIAVLKAGFKAYGSAPEVARILGAVEGLCQSFERKYGDLTKSDVEGLKNVFPDVEHIANFVLEHQEEVYGFLRREREKQETDQEVSVMNDVADLARDEPLIGQKTPLPDLPTFGPLLTSADKSKMNNLHVYINGFLRFHNRQQAKTDFLSLMRHTHRQDMRDIEQFEQNYNGYNASQALQWYSSQSVFYKAINHCLRLGTADAILYSRLAIKDLQTAISEEFKSQAKHFSGLLYRGAYLSEEEWASLQQNRGKDIEIYGFLSTTKDLDAAKKSLKKEHANRVLITIVVPDVPYLGEEGFVEMKDEVLFNIESKFTVLQTEGTAQGYRHLLLWYGAQEMRKYVSDASPKIELRIKEERTQMTCKNCNWRYDPAQAKADKLFVDLENASEFVCVDCMKKNKKLQHSAYILISMTLFWGKQGADGVIRARGMLLKHPQDLHVSKQGLECECRPICSSLRLSCVDCSAMKRVCWRKWFDAKNSCLESQHQCVVEYQPWTFWNAEIAPEEKKELDHLTDCRRRAPILVNGEAYSRTKDDVKAKQLYEKFLGSRASLNKIWGTIVHQNFGNACMRLEDYQNAVNAYSGALDISRSMAGEHSLDAAMMSTDLGKAYNGLGDFENSVKYYAYALMIRLDLEEEDNLKMAELYNDLGKASKSLGHCDFASQCYRRALGVRHKIQGVDTLGGAELYKNMGDACEQLGHSENAIKLYLQAEDIYRNLKGEYSLEVAMVCEEMALAHADLQDYQKATELHLRVLNIKKAVLGEKSVIVAKTYDDLGFMYMKLGDQKKGLDTLLQSLAIKKAAKGEQHSIVACSYGAIGLAYALRKDYKVSIMCYSKALEIYKAVEGEQSLDVAQTLGYLSLMYRESGDHKKAVEFLQQSLDIKVKIQGESSEGMALGYVALSQAYLRVEDYAQAYSFQLKAYQIYKLVLGEHHPDTVDCYQELVKLSSEALSKMSKGK